MTIGNWVRRRSTKWHLVESIVAGDAVTRCGRRMDRVIRSGDELRVSEVMPLTRMIGQPQLCKAGCDREEALAINEADNIVAVMDAEDGSTQPMTAGTSWTEADSTMTGTPGDVWELNEAGARVLYAAGTPEAAAWHAENATPHELTPPVEDDPTDQDV